MLKKNSIKDKFLKNKGFELNKNNNYAKLLDVTTQSLQNQDKNPRLLQMTYATKMSQKIIIRKSCEIQLSSPIRQKEIWASTHNSDKNNKVSEKSSFSSTSIDAAVDGTIDHRAQAEGDCFCSNPGFVRN